jgi:DNA-binding transcriptional LysR family regulator
MLAHAAEGQAVLAPGGHGASGLLRITASIPFGRKVVTPMLAGFLTNNPSLRVELRLSDAVLDITAQGIDLALRLGELRDNGLVARRLSSDPRGLYAAPDYLAQNGNPSTMADLRQHQCLTLLATTHWTFERDRRTVRQAIGGRFTADSVEALHQACLEGLGIARLSRWNVREDLASGRLVDVPLLGLTLPDHGVWAILPTRQFVPPKVRLFLDAFSAHLALLM